MRSFINIKILKFYLWVGLVYLVMWRLFNYASYPGFFWQRSVNEFWRCVYITGLNFFLFEYVLPFILKRKEIVVRILLAILALFVVLMADSFGVYAWRYVGLQLHLYTPLKDFPSWKEAVAYGTGYAVFSNVFFAIAKHIYNYIKLKETAQQLRIQTQEAELNYLRSQTNPHFLFNTLNNIYALARDKSDLAPESILRLSKILRFMLYETGGAYIAVEQELKIIDAYIALEKLRYDESLQINFNYDIEDMKQSIPPLLLIPLVENAFKHGVSETRAHPSVDIHLSVNKRQLLFVVKNSTEIFEGERTVKENIGLSNLRRQLELLYKDYELLVQQQHALFTASLRINLASHV
jgi:two-component system LytT family sensor kinase